MLDAGKVDMAMTDALIVAAGSGERFGDQPKQFVLLNGRPMIAWVVERFSRQKGIDRITLVVPAGSKDRFEQVIEQHGLEKVEGLIAGGETRQESVRLGLEGLAPDSDAILVHDGARPCPTSALIGRILETLRHKNAVIPTIPAVDTLIREASAEVGEVVDRTGISAVQTPQGFRTELLRRAHQSAIEKGIRSSDDGSLILAMGEIVTTVPGERTNIKVTFEDDVAMAEAILARDD
jgi:2-C-methyl-D-erythritol 4-phosphate cytidylyltransferase